MSGCRSFLPACLSILFGEYGTTLLTMLLSPYLYGPVFPEGVGSSCGREVHVKEFDVPLVDAEGLMEFRSLWYLGYQYLFSQTSRITLFKVPPET